MVGASCRLPGVAARGPRYGFPGSGCWFSALPPLLPWACWWPVLCARKLRLAITNLLWILLGALGGIVVPADRLPSLLQGIVHFLPSGALGQALRDAFLLGIVPFPAVLVLLLWTVLAGAAAIRWFKWN